MFKFCPNCGAQIGVNCTSCPNCGINFTQPVVNQVVNTPATPVGAKSRICAGLLAIFLGGLGIHNFYLGYTGKGVAQLLITLIGTPLTCGLTVWIVPVWALIEGIMILCGSINVDADGNLLGE